MKNMSRNTARSALVLAAAFAVAPFSAQAQEGFNPQHVLKTTVVSSREAAIVDLGSKNALGYYAKSNGQCELTVMVSENTKVDASNANTASRLQLKIKAGATARIDSAEGRSAAFFCGSGARRMTVMTLGPRVDGPQS